MQNKYFKIFKRIDEHPNNNEFKLHNHNGYEIFMFISGDSEFIIEGTSYQLQPYDIMIIRNDEMHHVHHSSDTPYERIVINMRTEFFTAFDCEKYKSVFINRAPGTNNKIASNIAYESGLFNSMYRLLNYDSKSGDETVMNAVLTEILYLLNMNSQYEESSSGSSTVSAIIAYINDNITEPLSLDKIANHFYISKYHLCKAFKAATGYTVNGYINYKRILIVKDLCMRGYNISTACMDAGFRNYSNFYKIYMKETGHSPKDDLKKHKFSSYSPDTKIVSQKS